MRPLSKERWSVVSPYLDQALELSGGELDAWLAGLRAQDPSLADDVAALIEEERVLDRQGFLETPALRFAPPHSLAGQVLGAYTLTSLIGQGGMGSVWLAERSDGRFQGRVAVKLLNLALLSPAGQARFRREGSLLARLAHPGIARLLDAGVSASGQPYLVLEHVEGQPIDAFADGRRLSLRERVGLLLQVLSAVAHAHGNLIVHRDLKPSNILVTADGSAKLLDFGIAKLLSDESEESQALTRDGRALTPEFAAPEQVRGDAITTATDTYAMGVLAYHLLAGRPPYGLAGLSPAEIERTVCHSQPVPPSATFEPPDNEQATQRALARGGTPARLRRRLRGDLDLIVLKALRKEPERRYASAEALEEDLRRYLDGRPVLARPDSLGYRARRFAGRNRRALAIAALGLVALAGGVLRERWLRARAEAEARKAEAVKNYLTSVFTEADPFALPQDGRDVTARALLDRGAARVETALTGEPGVQAEMRGVLGRVYSALGLHEQAAPLLRASLEQRRRVYGARHPAVAEALDQWGVLAIDQGRFDEAEPPLREALDQRRELLGNVDAATAESLDHLATLLQERGRYEQAEALFREALAVRQTVHGAGHRLVGRSSANLALLLYLRDRAEEAEPLFRAALEIERRELGEEHAETAQGLQNLAMVLDYRGKIDEAEPLHRRALAIKRKALGDAHPSVTISLNNLGNLLAQKGERLAEAEALVREALGLDRRMFGESHPFVAASLSNLAAMRRQQGHFDEAAVLFRQVLAMYRALFGPQHRQVARALKDLATTSALRGDLSGAIPQFRESLEMCVRVVGDGHRDCARVRLGLAQALLDGGQAGEAEGLFRVASPALDPTRALAAQVGLGLALTAAGRSAEAQPLLERALGQARERFGAAHWRTGKASLALGTCLAASRQHARAEPLLREAATALESQRRAQPLLVERAHTVLARLYETLGRLEEAGRQRARARTPATEP